MPIFIIPTVHLLLQSKDGAIFFLQRENTGDFDGMLDLPGGKVEEGETPILACIREGKEEAGIGVRPQDLNNVYIQYNAASKSSYINFYFTVWNWVGEAYNAEPSQCKEGLWIHPRLMPPNVIPHIMEAVTLCILRGDRSYRELRSAL